MRLSQSAFYLVAAALALAVGGTFAEDKVGKDKNDPGFHALDKDKDGYISREEAKRNPFSGTGAPMITTDPFSGVGQRSVMTDLVAWIASESRGMTIAPPMSHPKERLAYQAGERLFYYRAGPYDFGCVTCHGDEGKRIRLQSLPKMDNAKDAQRAFGTWPGYRVSEGELRSMQWRMWECIRQMRFPELEFASDASIALITYLAKKAEGGTFIAPAIKR